MTASSILSACLLDALAGDPRWFPHPVRLMGLAVAWYEGTVRRLVHSREELLIAGLVLAVGLPACAWTAGWGLIRLGELTHPWIGAGVEILLAYTTLAGRDLLDHVAAVLRGLKEGSLEEAREAVSQIVGRDTRTLSEPEVVRATVETIAESTSDGVVAPLFYLALGGAPLALAFKAISTLDSMVGHRDERYRDLGWASAKLDDAANWIPSRLTALLLVLAGGLVTCRLATVRRARRIVLRDGSKHDSPNSGWPEAAMAGVLHVQLGGSNVYDGAPVDRPRLGDPVRELNRDHIKEALTLMLVVSVMAAGLAACVPFIRSVRFL